MRKRFFKAVAMISACAVAFSSNGLTSFAAETAPESVETEEGILLDEVSTEPENEIIPEDSSETFISDDNSETTFSEETEDEDEVIEESEDENPIENVEDELTEDVAFEEDSETSDDEEITEETDGIDADEALLGAEENPEILDKGKDNDIDWYITKDYELFLSGEGNMNYHDPQWENYRDLIVKATADIKGATDLKYMFYEYHGLEEVDLSGLDTSQVTDMRSMFYACSNLLSVDLSSFDTSNVTGMDSMFSNCGSLVYADLSGFDTSNVTTFKYMFLGCHALETIDVSGFDTSNATDLSGFFECCDALKKVDVSSFDTRKATTMSGMFDECCLLTELDVSSFSTSQCKDMSRMFCNCRNLKKLNTGNLSTASAEDIGFMFARCSNLENLDLSRFSASKIEGKHGIEYFLENCDSLKTVDLSNMDISELQDCDFFSSLDSVVAIYPPKGVETAMKLPKRDKMLWVSSESEIVEEIPANNTSSAFFCISEGAARSIVTAASHDDKIHTDELWVAFSEPYGYTYTGKAIKPKTDVYYGGILLTEGKDYKVSYKNNVKAASKDDLKAPTVTVTGKGNITGKVVKKFDIRQSSIYEYMSGTDEVVFPVNGRKQAPVPEIVHNGYTLKPGKDYTLEYFAIDPETGDVSEEALSKVKNAGKYRRVIRGIGNYTDCHRDTITLNDTIDISVASVDKIPNQKFSPNRDAENGRCNPVKPNVTVKYNGEELEKGVDYTTRYSDCLEVGTGKVHIVGKGKYSGSKTVNFKIDPIDMSEVTISEVPATLTSYSRIYNPGHADLYYGDYKLKVDVNHTETVKYEYNKNKATVTFKGIRSEGFTGTVKRTINIKQTNIFEADFLRPIVGKLVTYVKGESCNPTIHIGMNQGPELVEGRDFTLTYKNNKKPGTAKVTITGKGVFTGKKTFEYKIVKKNLTDTQISVSNVKYSQKAGNYKTTVKIKDINDKALVAGKDYNKSLKYIYVKETTVTNKGREVVRAEGEEADKNDIVPVETKMYVSISSKGYYSGCALRTFRVTRKNIESADVKVEAQLYTGSEVTPCGSAISVKIDGVKLSEGDDYVIVGYSDNVASGSNAKVKIKGCGDYVGTKTVSFKITKQSFTGGTWILRLNNR